MNEDRKVLALEVWHSLLGKPEMRGTAPEQYEELLRLAEDYWRQGVIDRDERRGLVIAATERYARSVDNGRHV
ncbi:hypothetical protein K9857_05310 [Pseudomonas sp. REP124]|uniref:hypothetical protein n=1 Tax=Pseudomonas sp. REP124 TaxID=2875731 RepID=UPI001CC9BDB1|nr:hypothetical protein [Pseudomonas sp. REP124]MBZ9780965.1 hypothetical protein [Pseudomonas sp. REP124]